MSSSFFGRPASTAEPSAAQLALTYMEQKYGEPFTYVSPWGNTLTGTYQCIASCASLPDAQVVVQVENVRTPEQRVFCDNFPAVKYGRQTVDFLQSCADETFGRARVHYEVAAEALSPDLPGDVSFEDYLADTRVPLVVMVEVSAGDFAGRDQAQQLAEKIAAAGPHFFLTVAVVPDDTYGSYDRKGLNRAIATGAVLQCGSLSVLDDGLTVEWTGEEA